MLRHTIAATALVLALAAPAAAQSNDPLGQGWTNPDAAPDLSPHELVGRGVDIGVKATSALLTAFGETPGAGCTSTTLLSAAEVALDATRLAFLTRAVGHIQAAATALLAVADTAAGRDPGGTLCARVARPLYELVYNYVTDPRVATQRRRAANGLSALDARR